MEQILALLENASPKLCQTRIMFDPFARKSFQPFSVCTMTHHRISPSRTTLQLSPFYETDQFLSFFRSKAQHDRRGSRGHSKASA